LARVPVKTGGIGRRSYQSSFSKGVTDVTSDILKGKKLKTPVGQIRPPKGKEPASPMLKAILPQPLKVKKVK
jgi:hypothetical protein